MVGEGEWAAARHGGRGDEAGRSSAPSGCEPRRRHRRALGSPWLQPTEVLDAHLFEALEELQALTDTGLRVYNEQRPHDSLGRVPPLMFLPTSNPGGLTLFV